MSETTVKMCGLAIMALSVFAILFGLYLPSMAVGMLGTALVWGGVAAFFAGLVLFAVLRND